MTTRARKDVKLEDVKVHVLLFAFDCLFLNGEVLVEKPLSERRRALEAAIEPRQGVLQIAMSKVRCWPCMTTSTWPPIHWSSLKPIVRSSSAARANVP